jgi:hypothetical protein
MGTELFFLQVSVVTIVVLVQSLKFKIIRNLGTQELLQSTIVDR